MDAVRPYQLILPLIAALLPWLPWADGFAEAVPPALPYEAVFLRLALGGALAAFTLGTLRPQWRGRALVVVGACAAAAGFEALHGVRIVDPQEVGWVMHGQDARWYYLDFQFFRREPWSWPPGRITNLYYPVGTSVGNTDSVPLLSLPMKLVSAWLPEEFQFLGFWMFACVALQGVFAALLVRAAGGNWLYQSVALFLFLVSPSAVPSIERVGLHTARWLTMMSLWLYARPASRLGRDFAAWAIVIGVAGLTHPYTCVMVVPMALAYYVRRWLVDREVGFLPAGLCLAALALLLGTCWYLAGHFVVGFRSLSGELGHWSMNILSPIDPMGTPSLLRSRPTLDGQYEGFHYLGVGVLGLVPAAALVLLWRRPSLHSLARWLPISFAAVFLTVLALSPKVTFGTHVLFQLPQAPFAPFAPFRSSGRLFLPVVWMTTYLPLRVFARRLWGPLALVVVAIALYWQWRDVGMHFGKTREHHAAESRFDWNRVLQPEDLVFPGVSVDRVLFVPTNEWSHSVRTVRLIFAASHAGLAVSAGHASRTDFGRLFWSDKALNEQFEHGPLAPDAIYAVAPKHVEAFKQRFSVRCNTPADYTLCVAEQR